MEKKELIERICRRVVREFVSGMVVNLGIGIPSHAVEFLPRGVEILLQSENGLVGMSGGGANANITNASGKFVGVQNGACFFDSAFSFGLIRGGHIDLTVLGGLEVDEAANLANWIVPGKLVAGMGGAMDLLNGVKKVIVAMEHCDKFGRAKIRRECSLPLTGAACVDMVVTELAVFEFVEGVLTLRELMDGVSLEEVRAKTEARFVVAL